jgi:predicted PurR-regulated permease PerM
MLKRSQYWVLSAIGALCVVFVIVNMVVFSGNQRLQGQLNEQNRYLQESTQLQGLYQQMVQALANLSVRNHDEQLSAMLAKQGIKVNANAAAGSSTGAQAPSSSDTSGQESSGSRGPPSGPHD